MSESSIRCRSTMWPATPAIYHVNAFCDTDLGGNPAAVCLLECDRPPTWMQAVAAQMNLSETGFVRPTPDGAFSLRWFSPKIEVPLCGHVTLAAAHVLWNTIHVEGQPLEFQTASGRLYAHRRARGISIDLPSNLCLDASLPSWLSEALGIVPVRMLSGTRKYLVELASEEQVRNLQVDFERLRRAADGGVIVTARSDDRRYDIVSRYFAGYIGVDEDPVTGSAHCCLVPYWSERLGRSVIRARQLSVRGGELTGQAEGDRVHLWGMARTVLRGQLLM
jgi:PhzF family phenazine biosynthesis protein